MRSTEKGELQGGSANRSWFMDYRVINEPVFSRENRSVLIMVTSSPKNLERRNAIRRTWGSSPHSRVLFLIGIPADDREEQQRHIDEEVSKHRDIVQIGFVDTYRNLTLKSCALVLWAFRNSWRNRKLVIKADDDMCINMPLLSSIRSEFEEGVYGAYRGATEPYRCDRPGCSKWGLTLEEYGEPKFPPYVLGAFYVIEENALAKVHDRLFVPRFLFIEDVYITGLVARAANVSVKPTPAGARITFGSPGRAAGKTTNILAQHGCDTQQQHTFWESSQEQTRVNNHQRLTTP